MRNVLILSSKIDSSWIIMNWGGQTLNGTVQKNLERCLTRSTWTEREKQPYLYRIHVYPAKSIPEISKMTFSTSGHDRKYQISLPVNKNIGLLFRIVVLFTKSISEISNLKTFTFVLNRKYPLLLPVNENRGTLGLNWIFLTKSIPGI